MNPRWSCLETIVERALISLLQQTLRHEGKHITMTVDF